MAKLGTRQDNEHQSFALDVNNDVARRVIDAEAHQILTAIANAVGAATNTTPYIFNLTAAVAGTEYSQALPANTKFFTIKARGLSKIKLAYTNGGTASTYQTIDPGVRYTESNYYTAQTLYFAASKAGDTIEIVAYT